MTADIEVKILEQKEIASGVYYIKLARLDDFIPGQLLALSDKPGGEVRYYSLASGLDDRYWGILYNIVEDGWLTPWLKGLKVGNFLYTSHPFGKFLPVKKQMIWIGTGTGIAPFHSMVSSGITENAILIHGARKKEDFYFYQSFKEKLGANYIPCSSQMDNKDYYPGRLTKYLKEKFTFPRGIYYLCGSSSMVVDIRDLLLANGVEFNNIISEIYF